MGCVDSKPEPSLDLAARPQPVKQQQAAQRIQVQPPPSPGSRVQGERSPTATTQDVSDATIELPKVQAPAVASEPPAIQADRSSAQYDPMLAGSMESPDAGFNQVGHLTSLRDAHNAHAGTSMDDRKLKQFLVPTFGEDEESEEMTRSVYIKAKAMDSTPTPVPTPVLAPVPAVAAIAVPVPSTHSAPTTPMEVTPRKASPAAVERKRIAAPISPMQRLTPKPSLSVPSGGLDDFSMDDDDMKHSSSAGLRPVPNTRHVALPVTPKSPKADPRADGPSSPVPASKRGFLRQSSQDGECSTPGKAYHVLDNGMLYQIDTVSRSPASMPFGVDNRSLSLKNASLAVHDSRIDIIAEDQPHHLGKRVMSFEVQDEAQRALWVDALRQHIEFSDITPC